MQDWDTQPDYGPTVDEFLDEPENKPCKSRKKKKLFIIEARYTGPPSKILYEFYEGSRDWSTYRKYKSERGQLEGLKSLKRRKDSVYRYYRYWEYRIP